MIYHESWDKMLLEDHLAKFWALVFGLLAANLRQNTPVSNWSHVLLFKKQQASLGLLNPQVF